MLFSRPIEHVEHIYNIVNTNIVCAFSLPLEILKLYLSTYIACYPHYFLLILLRCFSIHLVCHKNKIYFLQAGILYYHDGPKIVFNNKDLFWNKIKS